MRKSENKLVVVILGPTASGKTDLSIELAEHFQTEIISADSRQFYKELSIGTAKPSLDQLEKVKHHFINSHSILDDYNAFDFENDALACIEKQFRSKDIIFVVGGSGLYLHAITDGIDENLPPVDLKLRNELNEKLESDGLDSLLNILKNEDPQGFNEIDTKNPVRIIRAIEISKLSGKPASSLKTKTSKSRPFDVLRIGLEFPREKLYARIDERVDLMMKAGLENEVKHLIPFQKKNALQTVGYRELFQYFDGEITLDEAINKIKQNSRRYAKRQLTWFRRYNDINWFEPVDKQRIIDFIQIKLSEKA